MGSLRFLCFKWLKVCVKQQLVNQAYHGIPVPHEDVVAGIDNTAINSPVKPLRPDDT